MKKLQSVQGAFTKTSKSARGFENATKDIGKTAEAAGKGAEKGSKGLGQFAQSLARIAKYRLLRTVLKELTAAFKEGLTNAYNFSKGIGGELAAAMDTMATKSLTMKNQLGSAFGELLMNIMPILLRFIEIVRTAANALAQLFAALGGRGTYLKAVDASQEWAKSTAGGAKAAKEWRNQLMGFDEINRLDAPESPGGGGGGGSAIDASKMFEVAEVEEQWKRLGERMRELLPVLKIIGAIIGGLSLLRLIGQVIGLGDGFKGVMSKLIGFAVALAGVVILWDGFKDALNNGVDWGNLTEMLAGTALLVTGLGVAFGVTGAAVGLLVGMFALAVSGLMDIIRTGEASKPALTALAVGITGIGLAISLLTGSWIPLLIGAVVGLVIAIVGYWDEIKGVLAEAWNHVVGWVNSFLSWIQPVIDAIRTIWDFFTSGASNAVQMNAYGADNMFPAYASGGYPEDGLFMANHGELVGQFANGKTAVANNAEIIAGIEAGVFRGMSDALAGQNNGSRDIRVFLDGREIGAATRRYERSVNRATGVAY